MEWAGTRRNNLMRKSENLPKHGQIHMPHDLQIRLTGQKKVGEFMIEVERHLLHLRRIWPHLMTKNVVRRKTDGKQIGRRTAADIFIHD